MNVKAIVHTCGKGLASLVLTLAGCTTSDPTQNFERAADRAGFIAGEIDGTAFRHRTFTAPARGGGANTLLVYLGGDGTPFLRRDSIAADPTPRRPLTLELMAAGPRPAVLLGRPCYHGRGPDCHPGLWTIGRYSEDVVASLTAAVRRLARQHTVEQLVLVGYSGGGTLALLVAERLSAVDAVVTLAANLDVDAWTALHGYSPLTTSLSPVGVAGRRTDLRHLHVTGDADRNVPPALHARLRERLPAEAFLTIAGFDHRCCWTAAWPRLAAELHRLMAPPARAARADVR